MKLTIFQFFIVEVHQNEFFLLNFYLFRKKLKAFQFFVTVFAQKCDLFRFSLSDAKMLGRTY